MEKESSTQATGIEKICRQGPKMVQLIQREVKEAIGVVAVFSGLHARSEIHTSSNS